MDEDGTAVFICLSAVFEVTEATTILMREDATIMPSGPKFDNERITDNAQ